MPFRAVVRARPPASCRSHAGINTTAVTVNLSYGIGAVRSDFCASAFRPFRADESSQRGTAYYEQAAFLVRLVRTVSQSLTTHV
jgi:hypothetical protein